MTDIMAVLNALAEPAFFCKDGKVTRCNKACAGLPLCPGDPVPILADAPEAACQTAGSICNRQWDISVLPMDGELLVLLKAQPTDADRLQLLDAAIRGFQQPLTALTTAGGALFSHLEELEDESLQTEAAALTRGIFRTVRNLNAMAEYSRLMRSEKALFVEKTHVKSFFEELVTVWTDMLQDSGITLEYHGPQKEFICNFDRNLVQRAVLTLLSNAAAWGQDGSPILLGVSYLGSRMKITVKNAGKAMDSHVFATAFSRHDHVSPLDDVRWGSGFGLPLARLIAQKHGGSVFLESNDSGTTVTMTFGLHTPESAVLETPQTDPVGRYDPALLEFSGILPDETYDSRNVDL